MLMMPQRYSTKTFSYTFHLLRHPSFDRSTWPVIRNIDLASHYSRLSELQSLLAARRRQIRPLKLLSNHSGGGNWAAHVDNEMSHLQTRVRDWLWEMERIEWKIHGVL